MKIKIEEYLLHKTQEQRERIDKKERDRLQHSKDYQVEQEGFLPEKEIKCKSA